MLGYARSSFISTSCCTCERDLNVHVHVLLSSVLPFVLAQYAHDVGRGALPVLCSLSTVSTLCILLFSPLSRPLSSPLMLVPNPSSILLYDPSALCPTMLRCGKNECHYVIQDASVGKRSSAQKRLLTFADVLRRPLTHVTNDAERNTYETFVGKSSPKRLTLLPV